MKNPLKPLLARIKSVWQQDPVRAWERGCAAAMVHRTFPHFQYHLKAEAEALESPAFAAGWEWGLDMPLATSLPAGGIRKALKAAGVAV